MLLVFGGKGEKGAAFNDLWLYSFDKNAWNKVCNSFRQNF
jgi:hypothetical protein